MHPAPQSSAAASAAPASAGIFFPPPLAYALGIVAGWALDSWHRLPIAAHAAGTRRMVAVAFALAYVAIFVSALRAFRRAHTTIVPNRPASGIVAEGPYRLTRNPMYISLVALYLAFTFWINSWWAILLLPLVVLFIDRRVIAREERYLEAAFPADYEAYRARVRRWL